MKFLNFLLAFSLIVAFTSCDTTNKLTSTTPTTSNSTAVTTPRSAPKKPTIKKPTTPKVTTRTAPSMGGAKDKVATRAADVKKPKFEKPKMNPNKRRADVKPKIGKPKVKKPKVKKPNVGRTVDTSMDASKTPGTITWEAANERYSAAGSFSRWRMTDVKMIGDDLNTLTAKLEIDLTSISEKSPKLTNHLKADDYFGVEEHQLATIEVTEVMQGKDVSTAKMTLKMRGKEQKLTGTFRVTSMKPLTIAGETTLDRSIFGVGSIANDSVPNDIKVKFDTVIPR